MALAYIIVRLAENGGSSIQPPMGADGLSDVGSIRYGYFIDEDITFSIPKETIRGAHDVFQSKDQHPDFIFIEGDTVDLVPP